MAVASGRAGGARASVPSRVVGTLSMARLPSRVDIKAKKRLLDDFFRIDEVELSHELFAGGMSPVLRRLVFDRGDAVAALLFDVDRRMMILVNQFRLPTMAAGAHRGWILETIAGVVQSGETPEECLIREVREEAGYEIKDFAHIATFFSSPGGSSERIFLYFAEVRVTDKTSPGGGLAPTQSDVEDIDTVEMTATDFYRRLDAQEFEDPKIIIAGQWFRGQFGQLAAEIDRQKSRTYRFRLKGTRKIIGVKTGDIVATRDVDVWVNPENTDMQMDRFFGRSISAAIRHGGARKAANGTIADDTIGKALAEAMNGRGFVRPAVVLETVPGALAETNNVQRLFHVATVQGAIGGALKTSSSTIAECMDRVLQEIHFWRRARSALVPLLGGGQGGLPVIEVAPILVDRAVAFHKQYPQSHLDEVFLLTYLNAEEAIVRRVLEGHPDLEPLPGATDAVA